MKSWIWFEFHQFTKFKKNVKFSERDLDMPGLHGATSQKTGLDWETDIGRSIGIDNVDSCLGFESSFWGSIAASDMPVYSSTLLRLANQ
jgi:hypothetical protein